MITNKEIVKILGGKPCISVKGYTAPQLSKILNVPVSTVRKTLII